MENNFIEVDNCSCEDKQKLENNLENLANMSVKVGDDYEVDQLKVRTEETLAYIQEKKCSSGCYDKCVDRYKGILNKREKELSEVLSNFSSELNKNLENIFYKQI